MENYAVEFLRRVVEAYESGRSGTYEQTAAIFGIGEATLSRALRRRRETGDVQPKKKGGNHARRVDLPWLRSHLAEYPDARLVDRIEAWVAQGGERVGVTAMWTAVHACGFTHKKRHPSPASATSPECAHSAKRSSTHSAS